MLSGPANMGWCPFVIYYLWRQKTSPSGLVLSLIYDPLLFGNTPIIVSMWAHLELKPNYTWGYTFRGRNVPSGNKRPPHSLAKTAPFFYSPRTWQEFCHLSSCGTMLSGPANMGWCPFVICCLWCQKTSPSGLVSSLIYGLLLFGNTPIIVSIWAHLESKPNYTWGYTLRSRNVPSGNKSPPHSLAKTAHFFILHGPDRNFAICRVVVLCCRA